MILAETILRKFYQKDKTPRFLGVKTPRVSLIGMCDRLHVALALDPTINTNFDPYYSRAGYMIQDRMHNIIKKEYPQTVQEVEVYTHEIPANCHPDIYIPELGHAIQVKSNSDTAAQQKKSHKSHNDQALLEWHFWRKWGYCFTEEGEVINEVPKTYEVFYVARESYGGYYFSHQIQYVTSEANLLEKKFLSLVEYIELEILPDVPKKKCKDCWRCPLNCFESEE